MTIPIWVYVLIGCVILWAKLKREQRRVYGLTELVGHCTSSERLRAVIEVVVFVSIGCLLSMGVVKPTTEAQALAAGLAWTGMTTR